MTEAYKGNSKHYWEFVTDHALFEGTYITPPTWRLRVPGGWIYRYKENCVFVPLA